MTNEFVHLHVHSRFSVRDGLASPKKLVDYAKMSGFEAMALTDHGNMGGHYQFAEAAAATELEDGSPTHPIHAIFGVEAYLCEDIGVKQSIEVEDDDGNKRKRRPKHSHVVLLAKDATGYSNLLKMMRVAADPDVGYYYEPRIDWPLLERHHEGLVCMSACLAGEVSRKIRDGDLPGAKGIADRYRQLFGDDYYLETQFHAMPEERHCYSVVESIADDLGIPLVATNDVHYILRSDAQTHSLLVAMRWLKTEKEGGSSDTRNLQEAYVQPEFYVKDAEQMRDTFDRRPDACDRTLEIAEKCTYEFPLAHSVIWPHYDIPVDRLAEAERFQRENAPHLNVKQAFLTVRVIEGLRKLGLDKDVTYLKQAKSELDVIFDLGYEDYFLVQDLICQMTRDAEPPIAMGPGRGSGAGSVVLYAIEVTRIDPIRNGLIFERFLNPGRGPQFDHRLPVIGQTQGGA